MTQLTIPKGGTFQRTWFVSGEDLTDAYARVLGYTQPGAGSPYLFDWNTSGGHISVTGSTVSGGRIDLTATPDQTELLNYTIASWDLRSTHSGNNEVYFYDVGRTDLVHAGIMSSSESTSGFVGTTSASTSFVLRAGSAFTGSSEDTGRVYVHTFPILANSVSQSGRLLQSSEYTISNTSGLTINNALFDDDYVQFAVRT